MPAVDPRRGEQHKVWPDKGYIEIVESLTRRKEEIGDIVGDVDSETNPSKVKLITEANKRKSDDMV